MWHGFTARPQGVPITDVLRTSMSAVDYGEPALARSEYALPSAGPAPRLSCATQSCPGVSSHDLPVERLLAPTHHVLTADTRRGAEP